jgi:hypothetical protein
VEAGEHQVSSLLLLKRSSRARLDHLCNPSPPRVDIENVRIEFPDPFAHLGMFRMLAVATARASHPSSHQVFE